MGAIGGRRSARIDWQRDTDADGPNIDDGNQRIAYHSECVQFSVGIHRQKRRCQCGRKATFASVSNERARADGKKNTLEKKKGKTGKVKAKKTTPKSKICLTKLIIPNYL